MASRDEQYRHAINTLAERRYHHDESPGTSERLTVDQDNAVDDAVLELRDARLPDPDEVDAAVEYLQQRDKEVRGDT